MHCFRRISETNKDRGEGMRSRPEDEIFGGSRKLRKQRSDPYHKNDADQRSDPYHKKETDIES